MNQNATGFFVTRFFTIKTVWLLHSPPCKTHVNLKINELNYKHLQRRMPKAIKVFKDPLLSSKILVGIVIV